MSGYESDTCGRSYTIRIRYMWTQIFLYPHKKICGYKNLRICVDGALDSSQVVWEQKMWMCALKSAMSQVMSNTSVKVSSSTKTWKGGFFPPIFVICFFWGGGGGWGLWTLLLPLLRRLYKGCFEIRILCKFLYLELGTVQKFLALCILQFSFISMPLSVGVYSSAISYDHWKTKPWASLL